MDFPYLIPIFLLSLKANNKNVHRKIKTTKYAKPEMTNLDKD
jgi:hypothetical protein